MRSEYYEAIFILPNPLFFTFFAIFIDFYLHKASVGKAHIPNWYFLLFFRPENTVQYFSEPRSTRSKRYKPLFPFVGPQFFAISTISTNTGPL